MSTQELLTFLFNAIALGFLAIAAIDFGTRAVTVYKQVSAVSSSPLIFAQQRTRKLPLAATPKELPQFPDPWLLPLPVEEAIAFVKPLQKNQKHLRLLPQATEISIAVAPKKEELLLGVNIDELKLRQARRIAKLLEIAQKVNGRDQKLEALKSQIKSKLQQAKSEVLLLVKQEVIAS